MSMSKIALVLAAAATLAACNRQSEEAPAPAQAPPPPAVAAPPAPPPVEPAGLSGFSHQPGFEVMGYYLPRTEAKVGKFALRTLHLGSAEEFANFEKGRKVSASYAPIMLEFDDVDSPRKENELGQPYHEVSRRVLPTAYRITPTEIVFLGSDPVLGEVRFEGKIDRAALERVRAGGAEEPVLSGTLSFMNQKLSRAFTWFGGD
jgi:hypothetical protein